MNSTILRCIRSNQILNLGTKRQAPWQPRAPGPRDVARCHQLRKRDERLWLNWIILSSQILKKTLGCMAVTRFFSFLPPRFSKLDLCLPIKLQEQVYFSYIGLIGIQIANYLYYHTAFSAYNKHTASRSHRIRNDKTFRPLVLLRHVVVRPRPAEASWDTVGTKDLLWVLIVVTLEIGGWIFASRWWQLLDTILVSTWLDILTAYKSSLQNGCVPNSTNKHIHKGGDPVHSI